MSWDREELKGLKRGPGEPQGRRVVLTEEELAELGLKVNPGAKCAACGGDLPDHSDFDCLIVMANAIRGMAVKMAAMEEALTDLEMTHGAARRFIDAHATDRDERYRDLVIAVNMHDVWGDPELGLDNEK